jgi:hypothetical protein
MASEPDRDRSRLVEPLPARPNLEMQQKRAKELLRAAWDGDASALERIQALHPRPPAPDVLTLADAQLVIGAARIQLCGVNGRSFLSMTRFSSSSPPLRTEHRARPQR